MNCNLRYPMMTREFQTQLLHYFSKSDNKSNHQSVTEVSPPCSTLTTICILSVSRFTEESKSQVSSNSFLHETKQTNSKPQYLAFRSFYSSTFEQIYSSAIPHWQIKADVIWLQKVWLQKCYSLLFLECHLISISNLNFPGLFSTKRGKRDLENNVID